jgi:hypothetical protein
VLRTAQRVNDHLERKTVKKIHKYTEIFYANDVVYIHPKFQIRLDKFSHKIAPISQRIILPMKKHNELMIISIKKITRDLQAALFPYLFFRKFLAILPTSQG